MWKRRKDKEHGVDGDGLVSPGGSVSEDGKSGEEVKVELEEEEKEGEDNKVMGKRTGKEKERTGMKDGQDPRRTHHTTADIKTHRREQNRWYERDHHMTQNGQSSTRAASPRLKKRIRQRNSRSRSPPRRL